MKLLSRLKWSLFGGFFTLCLGGTQAALASDLAPFKTVFDTDVTTAGYGGMRDIGSGSLSLSGVTGTVTEAYLYWHGPGNSTDENANAAVTFNGTDISGMSLGLSADNCWGFANSKAYRADVTSLISGDGTYTLENFTKTGENINGVSLIVFYDDGDDTNNRDVVIFDGNDSNIDNAYDAPGWNITLSGINYSSGSANIIWHVSDGQTFPDASVLINSSTFIPAGSVFDGDTTPAGSGGPDNGFLWDIRQDDITSLLSPGMNSLNISSGVSSDCLSCVAILIDLPEGAAPPPNGVPSPNTLVLLAAGLFGLSRRNRKVGLN
jgi:hypothetical protein